MCYEGVDEQFEYLDLSGKRLGIEGVLDVLHDLQSDTVIKQVNLSYNIHLDEVHDPKNVEHFLKKMRKYLLKNQSLTALDLAGNHLFYYHPHPSNEHQKTYEVEFVKVLQGTRISYLDLSENNLTGPRGREMAGFLHLLQQYTVNSQAFSCRGSCLTSQGLRCLVSCLGLSSSLTYLDLSDNLAGLDPQGRSSSEGIECLAMAVRQTPRLRTLKLSRCLLSDRDVDPLSLAIHDLAVFRDLSLAGNQLSHYACRGLCRALASHSLSLESRDLGFRSLDLSYNPAIGDRGIAELSFALVRTRSLLSLSVVDCGLTQAGGLQLLQALRSNSTLLHLLVADNRQVTEPLRRAIEAEVEINRLLIQLRSSSMESMLAVDASCLSAEAYHALTLKLRYLEAEELQRLHGNPSFTIEQSEMSQALYLLSPPPRRFLLEAVLNKGQGPGGGPGGGGGGGGGGGKGLVQRIKHSQEVARRVEASLRVAKIVLHWYRGLRKKKHLLAALALENRRRQQAEEAASLEDDLYSLASLSSTNTASHRPAVGGGGGGGGGLLSGDEEKEEEEEEEEQAG